MKRRNRRGMPVRGKVFIILACTVAVCFIFNMQIKPVVETAVANESEIFAVNVINQAVLENLGENAVSYENLISVSRDGSGNVQSITTNVVEMNMLKSNIIKNVQQKLGDNSYIKVWIPYGTFLGGDIFYGRGPKVPLKIMLSGNVSADFKSSFSSAGINQTRHQIYLNVTASVHSFLPGFRESTDVKTNVLVAETVIVGSVPQVVADLK